MKQTKPEFDSTDTHATGRRKVIKTLAVSAVGAPLVFTSRKSKAATIKLTVRDPGGPYVKAMTEAFYKPFNDAMKGDIVVTGVISQHEPTALIKSMVESKTYTWDIAGGFSIASTNALLEGPGYLEKLEIDSDPEVQEIPTKFRMPYLLGYEVFTCVLAYRTDVYPKKAPVPTGWKDLWDVKRIPGVRSLRKNPFYTIEQAVMAQGIPGNQVYQYLQKNGFEPAFKSLDQIRKNVNIWWTGAAQTSQLLATGEVDMVPTFNGRAQDAIDGGAPVALSWNEALWTYGGMAIIKGGPNIEACRKFIKFCANAERQATLAKFIAVGPTNPNAFKHIPPARAAVLGTAPANLAKSIEFDATFWGKEKDRATDRFNQWILG